MVRVIKSRRMKWAGHVALMEERRGVHRVLVGKPQGKRPLGRHKRRWEYNIKMDLQVVGRGGHGLDRYGSELGRVAGSYECSNEPSGSINRGEFLD